jgi:hypothetical protein
MKHLCEIINEAKQGQVVKKIQFNIDIDASTHSIERLNRKDAEGNAKYEPISFKEINAMISKATPEIVYDLVNDRMDINKDRFVLQRKSDGLTAVGVMTNVKKELVFTVITVYRGAEFRVGREQKIIYVE